MQVQYIWKEPSRIEMFVTVKPVDCNNPYCFKRLLKLSNQFTLYFPWKWKGLLSDALHEKCPNTELFLVCIFLHSDWIRTRNKSVFGHLSRWDGIEKMTVIETDSGEWNIFRAVFRTMSNLWDGVFCENSYKLKAAKHLRFCYLIKEMLFCVFSTKPLRDSCGKIYF